jgi:nicotinamide-nucleotide amidase
LNRVIHHRVLKVGELGESAVDHRIGAIMTESANPKVGVLARPGQVDVRISARADSPAAARALIAPTEARVRAALGDHIFAADEETLESVVAAALARHGWSAASYEDRTGGTVAAALHDAAGERFVEGRIVTTAAARTRLAEAGGEIAETPGGALAAAMARAVCRVSGADLALAVHACDSAAEGAADEMAGAATAQNLGPGNTWLAVAGATGELGHHLGIGVRGQVDRRRAAVAALSLLRRALL